MAIRAKSLTVNLPFGIGEITFVADEIQQRAAWELYVELETRTAVQTLEGRHGLLRETLTSLQDIFGITREILKRAGPDVADGEQSFGTIAIRVLNEGLRPFTAHWHPLLLEYEATHSQTNNIVSHERSWELEPQMREELITLQKDMKKYSDVLAKIAGAKFA